LRTIFWVLLNVCLASAQAPYFGPNPLGLRRGNAERDLLSINPYFSVGAYYGAGLGAAPEAPGALPWDYSSGGFSVSAGVNGAHMWRRSMLGIVYSASYGRNFRQSRRNVIGQGVGMAYTQELTPRTMLSLTLSSSLGNRAYAMYGNVGLGGLEAQGLFFNDPNAAYMPNQEIFDMRLFSVAGSADVTRSLGGNWALSFGGSAFTTLREDTRLADWIGESARVTASRRLGRRTSLGIGYTYTRFGYTRDFGDSNMHGMQVSISHALGQGLNFSLSAGGVRVERLGLARVVLDPLTAAVLGISTGAVVTYGLNYFGSGSASLSKSFRRSSASLGYNLGMTPGNGFYMTSRAHSGHATYTYSGFRRWSVFANASYTRWSELSVAAPPYESASVNAGVGRSLLTYLTFGLNGGYQHILSGGTGFVRDHAFAGASLGFSPGSFGLPGWW